MRQFRCLFLSFLVVILLAGSGVSLRYGQPAAPVEGATLRKLVLIPGFYRDQERLCVQQLAACDGIQSRSQVTFQGLLKGLVSSGYAQSDVLRYSYAQDWRTQADYFSHDTHQPLPLLSRLLGEQLAFWHSQHPGVRFDIIGHSLGGAIAAHWAGTTDDQELLRAVHSITAIESPLAGLDGWEAIALDVGCAGCQSLKDLAKAEVKEAVRRGATNVDVVNIWNQRDGLVLRRQSWLEVPLWRQEEIARCLPEFLHDQCHGSGLSDPATWDLVQWALANDGAQWSRRQDLASKQAMPAAPPETATASSFLVDVIRFLVHDGFQ